MIFLLSCGLPGWQADFGSSLYTSLLCVYSGITDVPKQTVAHAVSAKRRVSFMIGLKCEVFIYFALIFLKEAFQGLFHTVFLEFTT